MPEEEKETRFRITDADLHPHVKARMDQRGIGREEIERTLNEGQETRDAKPGTLGRTMAFPKGFILLTAKARYGREFPGR